MAFRHVFLMRLFAASHLTPLTRIRQQPTTPKIKMSSSLCGFLFPTLARKRHNFFVSLNEKLRRHLKNPNTQIRVREKTTKLCFYTNNKDKVPLLNKSHVVYKFSCPGCQSSYIGKTDRTLLTRTREHAVTDKESAIYKHLRTCEHLAFIHNLLNLPDTLNNITAPTISSNKDYVINVVQNNTTVLDFEDNWNLLLYKEAFHIKRQSPSLNNGLKSSRELCLFS